MRSWAGVFSDKIFSFSGWATPPAGRGPSRAGRSGSPPGQRGRPAQAGSPPWGWLRGRVRAQETAHHLKNICKNAHRPFDRCMASMRRWADGYDRKSLFSHLSLCDYERPFFSRGKEWPLVLSKKSLRSKPSVLKSAHSVFSLPSSSCAAPVRPWVEHRRDTAKIHSPLSTQLEAWHRPSGPKGYIAQAAPMAAKISGGLNSSTAVAQEGARVAVRRPPVVRNVPLIGETHFCRQKRPFGISGIEKTNLSSKQEKSITPIY